MKGDSPDVTDGASVLVIDLLTVGPHLTAEDLVRGPDQGIVPAGIEDDSPDAADGAAIRIQDLLAIGSHLAAKDLSRCPDEGVAAIGMKHNPLDVVNRYSVLIEYLLTIGPHLPPQNLTRCPYQGIIPPGMKAYSRRQVRRGYGALRRDPDIEVSVPARSSGIEIEGRAVACEGIPFIIAG